MIIQKINEIEKELGKNFINRFIGSYNDRGKEYIKFLSMKTDGKTHEDISRIIGVSCGTITYWINKKYVPHSIKNLIKIYDKGYFKSSKVVLARLIGWLFGDGGINDRLHYFFICGTRNDLEKIKIFIEKNFNLKCEIEENHGNSIIKKYNGNSLQIKGENWILRCNNSLFARFLYSLDTPKGEKVLQKFNIPNWIMTGNNEVKKAFLNSILEAECQTHKVRIDKKIEILPVSFGMNKIGNFKSNLVSFLNEIKCLLSEFNIRTSQVEEPKPAVKRKDNKLTYSSRFYISVSATNIMSFSNAINYEFNEEKKIALQIAVEEAKNKISRQIEQIEKYEKLLELRASGMTLEKISKTLGLGESTVLNWLKGRHLPYLIQNKEKFG